MRRLLFKATVRGHTNEIVRCRAKAQIYPHFSKPITCKSTAVSKARMQMQAVRNDADEAVAIVLNIRKGKAQRLYLWHDGAFRPNP